MKFTVCYSLIEKRGFFLYQNFFSYEDELAVYFSKWSGTGLTTRKYLRLWFELPSTGYNPLVKFQDFGVGRSSNFGYFMLNYVPPHTALIPQMVWGAVRVLKIYALRGKRHAQGLPVRGQRTHSNSSTNLFKMRIQTVLQSIRAGVSLQRLSSLGKGRFSRLSLKIGTARRGKTAVKTKTKKTSDKSPTKKKPKTKADVWK